MWLTGNPQPQPPHPQVTRPSDNLVGPRSGPTAHPPSPYLKPEVHLHLQSPSHSGVEVGAHLLPPLAWRQGAGAGSWVRPAREAGVGEQRGKRMARVTWGSRRSLGKASSDGGRPKALAPPSPSLPPLAPRGCLYGPGSCAGRRGEVMTQAWPSLPPLLHPPQLLGAQIITTSG